MRAIIQEETSQDECVGHLKTDTDEEQDLAMSLPHLIDLSGSWCKGVVLHIVAGCKKLELYTQRNGMDSVQEDLCCVSIGYTTKGC